MTNRDPGRASGVPPRREGEGRDWSVVVEDGTAKTNEPVSSAVADPEATTLRHEPHEPPRQHLPAKLFEKRTKVHNKRIDGPFRRFKWFVMFVTLAIYYGTPWIRWDRGPYAPDQAVLVDLANRRFYMFGIEIWPHEFYYVAGMLIMAALGLFLVTSAVGRAWCGYACPQTVWTDLFQHVDRFVDGDRNARIRLDAAPLGPQKFAKRALKYTIYLVISFWTGGAWIMYFADAPTLVRDFWAGEAAPAAYITVAILTLTTFTLGGFMREQVCIYMCPWPRIQTAMMDEKSLLVTYKDWRGEPRGSVKKAERNPGKFGDCIDCQQCVAVCPTGIDIREGPQVGCITCALCIDACDEIMDKIGKPRGLIDYMALKDEVSERAGEAPQSPLRHILRPRTLLYFVLWGGIGVALVAALFMRAPFELNISPMRNPLFVTLADGSIRNTYELRLRNKEGEERRFAMTVDGAPLNLSLEGQAGNAVAVAADQTATQRLYLTAAPDAAAAGDQRTQVTLWVTDSANGDRVSVETHFNGREDD